MDEERRTRPTRRPPGRPAPHDQTPERLLALAGVAGLLAVLVVSIVLVLHAAGGDDPEQASASVSGTPAPTATPTPTSTPKPRKTPVPLTAAERAQRSAAADVVASRGFKVVRLRDYDPDDTLRVLIGRTTAGGYMAFFFVGEDYIGNDSRDVSRGLAVRRTSDLTTTLRYTLAATAGGDRADHQDVRFTWDGVRLTPESALPDLTQRGLG